MKLFRFPMFAAFLPTLKLCAYLMSFILVIAVPASASAQTGGALPAAAQDALDDGILAAKVPDYLLAIRYFEDARKIAPDAPLIYLNLGLAESRIPGRELRAIAWFSAYLAANPKVPNAAAVRKEIHMLMVKNQSNLSRLIKSGEDAASQIAAEDAVNRTQDRWGHLVERHRVAVHELLKLWTRTGDITAAKRVAEMRPDEFSNMASIASEQAIRGDFQGARQTLDSISSRDSTWVKFKPSFYELIATTEKDAKDATSQQTAYQAKDWLWLLENATYDALGSAPILDLAGYLKKLPPSDDSEKVLGNLLSTLMLLADLQSKVEKMLKEQAKQ